MRDRVILHSDLNSFYASVEIMLDPSLRDKAVAVCGDTNDRHGIVLAKSELAKRAGVKTAMVNWEAKRLCPELIMIPPHFDQYKKYSYLMRQIYYRYTDQVEPFGLDECWLDVTGSRALFGDGLQIAEQIRIAAKEELGLTVSIGVSFNKIFAKIGSDMKKPDAITVISRENFKQLVWPLPASDLLFVGRSTKAHLDRIAVHTIGDLAQCDPMVLQQHLGKSGYMLWQYANGEDTSPVLHQEYVTRAKSVGHGVTCAEPIQSVEEAEHVFVELSQDVASKLRREELCACGVQISVKDENLKVVQYQKKLHLPTQNAHELVTCAMELFAQYPWKIPVRALTIRAIDLCDAGAPQQVSLFEPYEYMEKQRALDAAIDSIRGRFGDDIVRPASVMTNRKMPHGEDTDDSFAENPDRGMRGLRG